MHDEKQVACDELYLRKACKDDCDLLFAWANDEITRKNSFNTKPIEYVEHCKWFQGLMKDDSRQQYIFVAGQDPIGQVRLSFDGETAEIGYSIDEQKRGLGYGKVIISKAVELIKKDYPNVKFVNAKVKPTNIASVHCFLDNGFAEEYSSYRLDIRNTLQCKRTFDEGG